MAEGISSLAEFWEKMNDIQERICSISNLNRAFKKRKSCRMWKHSVSDYYLHMARYNYILHNQLVNGTYKVKPCYCFSICDPKPRDIQAPHLLDGIVQSSTNTNFLHDKLRWVFLDENTACQIAKGTDYARELFKTQLRRYFRKYGRDGVVLKIDIKGYFKSIDGDSLHELNKKYIQDDWVISYLEQWGVKRGEKGLGLGAETNQTESCLALHPVDHFIKTVLACRYYVRYQDDIVIVLRNAQEARLIRARIEQELFRYKLSLNRKKTQIYKLSEWVLFLGFKFTVTKTGKVLMKIKRAKVSRIKRRIRHQARLNILSQDIMTTFACWKANASKGNNYFTIKDTEAYTMEIVREQREMEKRLELSQARLQKLLANFDYLAMMSDVEIPSEETQETQEVQHEVV